MRFVLVECPSGLPKGPLEAARMGRIAVKRDVCEGDGLRETVRCAHRGGAAVDISRGGLASECGGAVLVRWA